ncbi:MAG: hypothetical protein OXF20_00080 [Gammaproteobacteria bacterium]|nr:hypothetical protein [Gammaproteobacteria bacterium]
MTGERKVTSFPSLERTSEVQTETGRWMHMPAGPAPGLAGPDCVVYDAGKSRLSPFRVRVNASRSWFFPVCLVLTYACSGISCGYVFPS